MKVGLESLEASNTPLMISMVELAGSIVNVIIVSPLKALIKDQVCYGGVAKVY